MTKIKSLIFSILFSLLFFSIFFGYTYKQNMEILKIIEEKNNHIDILTKSLIFTVSALYVTHKELKNTINRVEELEKNNAR